MGAKGADGNVTKVHAKVFAGTKSGTPGGGGKDYIEALNPNSLKVVTAFVESSLAAAKPDEKFQF